MFGLGKPNVEKMKGKKDVNGLIKALGYEKDFQVRKDAARALGELRDQRVVEPLINALGDSEIDVQRTAAEMLVKIGEPSVDPLIHAFDMGYDWRAREFIVWALGNIGNKHALKTFIEATSDENNAVRLVAAIGLGKIEDSRAAEYIIKSFNDAYNRSYAISEIVKIGTPAIEPLTKALSYYFIYEPPSIFSGTSAEIEEKIAKTKALRYSNYEISYYAADALEKIGWKPGKDEIAAQYWVIKREWGKCVEIGEPAVDLLIKVLRDSNYDDPYYDVRSKAKEALIDIGPPAVAPLLENLKKYSSGYSFSELIEMLAKIGDVRASEPIIKDMYGYAVTKLYQQSYFEKHERALRMIGWVPCKDGISAYYWIANQKWDKCVEIGEPAVLPLIASLNPSGLNHNVLLALEKIGDARAIKPLIEVLKSKSSYNNYRKVAAKSLIKYYKNERIDQNAKNEIFSTKALITDPHHDESIPTGAISDCTSNHTDLGVGLDFPD